MEDDFVYDELLTLFIVVVIYEPKGVDSTRYIASIGMDTVNGVIGISEFGVGVVGTLL